MEAMDTVASVDKQRHYCGPPGLTFGDLWERNYPSWPSSRISEGRVYFTHKGRCGIGCLCRFWHLQAGDEILAPAYHCGSETDPFLQSRIKLVYYRVDAQANIDISDIQKQVTPRTRAVYVIHYFGWPQPLEALAAFCQDHRLYLVEDCALSLFSRPSAHPIGRYGDAVIYNFPKTLPVPDGGALVLSQTEDQAVLPQRSPPCIANIKPLLSLIKRTILRRLERWGWYALLPLYGPPAKSLGSAHVSGGEIPRPDMPASYYFDPAILHCRASRITRHVLRHTDLDKVVQRRRSNYQRLFNALKGSDKFRPLYQDLPEGVCPLHLPILLDHRDQVARHLQNIGIAAIPWWAGYHWDFNPQPFPEAAFLKNHVLTVPIHQQLSGQDIDYIAMRLKQVW